MPNQANTELIQLLHHDTAELRMLALHWLAEGYANEPEVLSAVFAMWDQHGVEGAFPEFPMLSHLSVPAEMIEECCQRASAMVQGKPLKGIETRSAGKLIEQVSELPAALLAPHLNLLEQTVARSKIFFRVDIPAVRNRVELLNSTADQLSGQLDSSIERLAQDAEQPTEVHQALHALEALRREHPSTINLGNVLQSVPPSDGPQAISFQLTLQSLVKFAEPGLEEHLAPHLLDPRESIFIPAIDALVRAGSEAAGESLLAAYLPAAESNRQWIARGLQRLRVKGLASRLAELRAVTEDPKLWLMLLVAEIRQTDASQCGHLAAEIDRVIVHSYALVNALLVFKDVIFSEVIEPVSDQAEMVASASSRYLERIERILKQELESAQSKLHMIDRRGRERARLATLRRYRKGR